jgi:GntR family transcriptional regulator
VTQSNGRDGATGSAGPYPLDRDSPLPLWAQLLADLRRRLALSEFAERFPTDMELTAEYRVSRHTVREAVRRLDSEGLLDRRQGLGTRVRPAEFELKIGGLLSLFRVIEGSGTTQVSEVRALEIRTNPEAAHHLGRDPDAELVYLERLRLAGDDPLALDRVWLPADVAGALLEADFRHTALYDELATRCGISLVSNRERVEPVVPTASEAGLLGLARGRAAFALERWSDSNRGPVEWRHTLIRGDRYHIVAEWTASGGASGAGSARDAELRLTKSAD